MAPAGAQAPAVPLVSVHHSWDHHWFAWLPRHPVYEAAEIMSIDAAGSPYRAVWVFFTERRGGKRQTHFLDDRRIVERFAESHYRPISYERSGAEGRAQSVRVALDGLDGVPIEIAVDLADRKLTREEAGLTDQSGHNADTLFLLFHRDFSCSIATAAPWRGPTKFGSAGATTRSAAATIRRGSIGSSPPTAQASRSRSCRSGAGRSPARGRGWTLRRPVSHSLSRRGTGAGG